MAGHCVEVRLPDRTRVHQSSNLRRSNLGGSRRRHRAQFERPATQLTWRVRTRCDSTQVLLRAPAPRDHPVALRRGPPFRRKTRRKLWWRGAVTCDDDVDAVAVYGSPPSLIRAEPTHLSSIVENATPESNCIEEVAVTNARLS